MSEIDFLKLKKHDNPETNTEKFDIENYLNGNWDKINGNAKKVNTDILNIQAEQETQNTNIEENNSKIIELQNEKAKLEKELKEAQEDFYQNSIRGQASGEYIHVEDSSNCRAKIGIGGNSEQEKRSGKNKYNATINKTVNNVSIIADIQYFILNGTSSADGRASFRLQTLKAGTYTVNLKYINGSFSNSANYPDHILRIWKGDSWNTFGTTIDVNSTDKSQVSMTFTLEEDTEISLGAYYRVTDIYNNIKYAYQIVEGSNSDFDFEPYGAMPSPDYRSEVKSVGSNVNIYDKETMPLKSGLWIGSTPDSNITTNSRGNYVVVPIVGGKTYTISKKNATGTIYATTIASNAENGVKVIDRWDGNSGLKSYTIKTSSTAKYLFVGLFAGTPSEEEKEKCIEELKVEKGTVATPYSKYGQGCVKVTKCNKNWFNVEDWVKRGNNSTYYSYEDGEISINKLDDRQISKFTQNERIYLPNGNYVISGTENVGVRVYNDDTDYPLLTNNFEVKLGYIYLKLVSSSIVKCKPMIKLESVADNTYELHQEQSYIMPVQKEMLQGDYFDFDNEEEVHTWNKLVLDGNEKYWEVQNSGNRFYLNSSLLKAAIFPNNVVGEIYCTHFKRKTANNTWNGIEGISYANQTIAISCRSIATDASTFIAYLKSQYDAETPVIVYYKLQTPTRLKFTEEQKAVAKELNNARTYKNVTNITTDSKAILSLDYAKDLETLLNNTQALAVNNASEGV